MQISKQSWLYRATYDGIFPIFSGPKKSISLCVFVVNFVLSAMFMFLACLAFVVMFLFMGFVIYESFGQMVMDTYKSWHSMSLFDRVIGLCTLVIYTTLYLCYRALEKRGVWKLVRIWLNAKRERVCFLIEFTD